MKSLQLCGVVWLLCGGLAACGGGSGADGTGADAGADAEEGNVGQVSLSLTTVPTGVQCVQVSVWRNATTTILGSTVNIPVELLTSPTFTVSGSPWKVTVPLGSFYRGSVTVSAVAYSVACTALAGATASWVTDGVTVDVTPGRPSPAALNFRQNLGVAASANFAPTVVDIATGGNSTGFVFADGTIKIVGSLATPTNVTGVAELALGYNHACARKTDGTVWCWGSNDTYQLGNGTTTNSLTTAVQATGLTGATSIVSGGQASTTCATTVNSTYCWGADNASMLQDSSSTAKTVPTVIAGSVAQVALNTQNLCSIGASNLRLLCSGDNSFNQQGNGDSSSNGFGSFPLLDGPITSVAVGAYHSCAVNGLTQLFCWGYNGTGQVGIGTSVGTVSIPTRVTGVSGAIAEAAASNFTTCSRATSGDVMCWGSNFFGQVGDSTLADSSSPHTVLFGSKKLRAGADHFCSMQADASVQCWGYNGYGQLGDGTRISSPKPIAVKL